MQEKPLMKRLSVLGLWKIKKMSNKKGFTLIEVLISVTLLSLVLMALYKSEEILRDSNRHLFKHLQSSTKSLKGSKTLFIDIMKADNNITIDTNDKFHRLTLTSTGNSLYGQGRAKVVWLVYKEQNTLLRLEGGEYDIPLKTEQNVEIDVIAKNVELFKVYKSKTKTKILAMLKLKGQEAQVFMSQNLQLPPKPPKKKKGTNTPTPSPIPSPTPNH